jgi:signal recognition particle receptor subunit alpha
MLKDRVGVFLFRIFHRKSPKSSTAEKAAEKAGKKPRIWDLGGTNKDLETLERTTDKPEDIKSHFTPDTEVNKNKSKAHNSM